MTGLCECGCGGRTQMYTRTYSARGAVAGMFKRFMVGHNSKTRVAKGYKSIGTGRARRDLHRIRAERALGHPLPKGACVHHADGTKSEQSPLVICPDQKYHKLLHARMRVKAAGGDPNLNKICACCKALKRKTMFAKNKSCYDGLHPSCLECTRALCRARRHRFDAIVADQAATIAEDTTQG